MSDDESSPEATPAIPQVVPLPHALYESNGVAFELYQGGRPHQALLIRWRQLRTFTVVRGELTFHVRVSQADSESSSE